MPKLLYKFDSRFIAILMLLASMLYSSTIQSQSETFKRANALYKATNYEMAAKAYDSILKFGLENAEVHYNLGNVYFKLEQLGLSILHYEKALKFNPEDEDVLYNLKLANAKLTDKVLTVPELKVITWWKQFRKSFTSKGWGNLALVFVWTALLFFLLYLFTDYRRTGFVFGSLLLAISVFLLWMRFSVQQCETGPDTGILIAKSVYVKSGPDAASTDLFIIHEGLKLQVKDNVGSWCKVRLADGKTGWIEQDKLGLI